MIKGSECGDRTLAYRSAGQREEPLVATFSMAAPPEAFLGQSLRITVSDARVIQGTLESLDAERNLVLSGCQDVTDDVKPFQMGVVVIPGQHVVKCMQLESSLG